MSHRVHNFVHKSRRLLMIVLVVLALFTVGSVWHLRNNYEHNLQPVSSSTKIEYFTIPSGTSLSEIASGLQAAHLIRSSSAFTWYVRSNELRDKLQAGTYALSQSMSTSDIANKIAGGEVAKNLLTILPGKRLDQVEQELIDAGYSKSQAEAAMNVSNYSGNPALSSLPAGKSLEGYLFPDSFQKMADTPATSIVRESLDEMANNLTPQIIAGFHKQGLTAYQGITLASIVEQESGKASDDPTIAQVFLLRLKKGMPLGSDVTAAYASAVAGQPFNPGIHSPYNTRLVKGLPPGPIGTISATSLAAVATPANSSYLYFVTGDNGTTYFSYTEAQHEALVQKYCIKSCQ